MRCKNKCSGCDYASVFKRREASRRSLWSATRIAQSDRGEVRIQVDQYDGSAVVASCLHCGKSMLDGLWEIHRDGGKAGRKGGGGREEKFHVCAVENSIEWFSFSLNKHARATKYWNYTRIREDRILYVFIAFSVFLLNIHFNF